MEGHLVFKWNRFCQMIANLDDRLDELGVTEATANFGGGRLH